MTIDNIISLVAGFFLTDNICNMAYMEDVVGLKKTYTVFKAQSLAMLRFFRISYMDDSFSNFSIFIFYVNFGRR